MSGVLSDIVRFRADKLFNGAINVDWLEKAPDKASAAAKAFVFHGPTYHGVSQADISDSTEYLLEDSASFINSIFRSSYGIEEQPFTLAIAGYGTGKSHLALTVAKLLANPTGDEANAILASVKSADQDIYAELDSLLKERCQPCLAITLNGMQNFDLAAEIFRQLITQLQSHQLDTKALDELRPRFAQAANLLEIAANNQSVVEELIESCSVEHIGTILEKLAQHDETIYSQVHKVLEGKNIKIAALGGESVGDVIELVAREYCGLGKPFRSIVIIFDEFGRYTEFATVRSHIAGSGALQDLFEAVQNNANKVCFVGFIQFELNAYIQRVAPEHRNEILRYITRYQAAKKTYLSINLETLMANLIEKKNPNYLSSLFDVKNAFEESQAIKTNIAQWFPAAQKHRVWTDLELFHNVIRKGCWPLAPYSVWLLFYLAAAGKHLQERSALSLLDETFARYQETPVHDNTSWAISPVDLLSESLLQELLIAEEGGQQGSIAHSYTSVVAKHGGQLTAINLKILKSIVLSSKLAMKSISYEDAKLAIAALAGVNANEADVSLRLLREEFNIVEWDEAFKQFDILGDAVPRTQFLSYIRQRVASTYDNKGKASLFSTKASEWCDLLTDIDCDFAEKNKITTREWRYQAVTSNLDIMPMHIKLASDKWQGAVNIDDPRGTVLYCYVEATRDINSVIQDASIILRKTAKNFSCVALPILIVLLVDEDGKLGQSLAEVAILEEGLSPQDTVKFGNLVPAHKEKMRIDIRSRIEDMVKQRHYVTAFKDPLEATRLGKVGTEIFTRIYKSPITFPFDGFTTARGNASQTCQTLTTELLLGRLDYHSILAKPAKDQNRARTVLSDVWGIFSQNGNVRKRPEHPILRSLTEKWDDQLANDGKKIPLQDALKRLCSPPYGANIASAGLFLGAFIAPRIEKLSIIKAGQPLAVTAWVQEDIFKGNYIDLNGLHDVEIVESGGASSEWETLLDEWELAETYSSRKDCYLKADDLRKRTPVPSAHTYRLRLLEDFGQTALTELKKNDDFFDAALNRIEKGGDRDDAGAILRGAVDLDDLVNRMTSNKQFWSEHEIEKIRPHAERARQYVINVFPEWLMRQTPKDSTPVTIGDFKHWMIKKVGGGLQKLQLDELYSDLMKHTATVIKKSEIIASAHSIVRDSNSWLLRYSENSSFVRVAELRSLLKTGEELGNHLRGLQKQVQIVEIQDMRSQVAARLENIKKTIKLQQERLSRLLTVHIKSMDDLEVQQNEVRELLSVFEGCNEDLNELKSINRLLRFYESSYQRLCSETLTWDEFEELVSNIIDSANEIINSEELSWDATETMKSFSEQVSNDRRAKSEGWIQSLSNNINNIVELNTTTLNIIYNQINCPPPFITGKDREILATAKVKVIAQLNELEVDWLVTKFKELSQEKQQLFVLRLKQELDTEKNS